MENIPRVPFPEGYGIRPMRLGEGALWTDIERDAEEYFPIGDDLFEREFARDLQATQWRCYFVVNEKGVAVGTISAWYDRRYRGEDHGVIHWVAIRPAYQGKGLGKAALSYTLTQMAQWHDRCMLGTQSKRLPAINLYLDFGLLPDLEARGAIEGWREVKARLKHPALEANEAL
jgi:GNAT superfamily N-acetyltransferase